LVVNRPGNPFPFSVRYTDTDGPKAKTITGKDDEAAKNRFSVIPRLFRIDSKDFAGKMPALPAFFATSSRMTAR